MSTGSSIGSLRISRRLLTMIVACLSSVAVSASRRPAAFASLSRHARRPPSSLAAYSAETMRRTKGKNRLEELANMSERMQLDEAKLKELLAKRLSAMDAKTEKAEYIDWLLSAEKKTTPSPKTTPKQKTHSKKPISSSSKSGLQTFATDVHFAERTDLHPLSKRAITEVMGLTTMTEIQSRTFEAASSGKDVLGRARTGTGKTLAFLLPAIERILQNENHVEGQNVGILIVSPTRELASQIADQAEKLLTFHRGNSVQVMFGGTNMKRDINQLNRKLPTILVATPGRLLDHMQSTTLTRGNKFGKDIMSKTPVVVLDETDRLLDMGFRKEISKILSFLPRGENRQTLLFSATIPPDLKVIMAQNMRKDFIEVDCINDGDAASHTNEQVQQSHVIVPHSDRFVSSVVELVQLAMNDDREAKIVVFFPTARMVAFFAELFNEGLKIPVIELHSKKSQGFRNRMSEAFRETKRGVLFTSDVSARGVDYPNVSHVIQFGMPESRDQYIHRLGRTGRAGTEGKGWLVLSKWESLFLQELNGVEIPVNDRLRHVFESPMSVETVEVLQPALDRIRNGDKILSKSAKGAYQAFLGYYLGQMKRMRMNKKEELVGIANDFALLTGLERPPPMSSKLVGKMGLKGVGGVTVMTKAQDQAEMASRSRPDHHDGRRAPSAGRSRYSRGRR